MLTKTDKISLKKIRYLILVTEESEITSILLIWTLNLLKSTFDLSEGSTVLKRFLIPKKVLQMHLVMEDAVLS